MTAAARQQKWYESKGVEYHREYREKNRAQRRKWNRDWIDKNRERYNASKYIYRENLKKEAVAIYSIDNDCAICGCTDIDVLCLDHIDDDGAEDRKRRGISGRNSAGTSTYAALKRDGWPGGFQVLCANCNLKKEMERKRQARMENKFYEKWVREGVMPSVKHND